MTLAKVSTHLLGLASPVTFSWSSGVWDSAKRNMRSLRQGQKHFARTPELTSSDSGETHEGELGHLACADCYCHSDGRNKVGERQNLPWDSDGRATLMSSS